MADRFASSVHIFGGFKTFEEAHKAAGRAIGPAARTVGVREGAPLGVEGPRGEPVYFNVVAGGARPCCGHIFQEFNEE